MEDIEASSVLYCIVLVIFEIDDSCYLSMNNNIEIIFTQSDK